MIDASLPFVTSFLFVFAVIYGLLATAKVMPTKNVNAIIALAIAAMTAAYEPFVLALQSYMPLMAAVLVPVFFLIVIKKLFFSDKKEKSKKDMLPAVFALGIMLLIIRVFWSSIEPLLPAELGSENALWIVGIFIIAMIFYLAYRHEKEAMKF